MIEGYVARNSRMVFAAALSLAVLALIPGGAQALKLNQCGDPSDLSAEMKREGETTGKPFSFVATMESLAVDSQGKTAPLAQFIAANSDNSRFYILTGNVPLNAPNGRFCVTLVGRDLEINDYRLDRPARLINNYTFADDEARAQCHAIIENVGKVLCENRDRMLERANDLHAQRLALQGILLSETGADTSLLTVIAVPADEQRALPEDRNRYATLVSADEGATTILESGFKFSFTAPVLERLDEAQD